MRNKRRKRDLKMYERKSDIIILYNMRADEGRERG